MSDDERGREVVVPERLYKSVTVFSTLFAVVTVVLGFVSLDQATNSGRAAASEVSVPLAVLGVGFIAAGGLVYAFASRFRARGMVKDKDSDDESTDNG
ncbi:DUF7315 family membrane protein [Halobacterium zhouii]|uniref:DUF7315 family membrane protein n=1 Tax=Halobacterium zhouii TaxID=2902624 RepID=UPI001E61C9B7|nr:hypothetical protein [Halobacterium zhouii]